MKFYGVVNVTNRKYSEWSWPKSRLLLKVRKSKSFLLITPFKIVIEIIIIIINNNNNNKSLPSLLSFHARGFVLVGQKNILPSG